MESPGLPPALRESGPYTFVKSSFTVIPGPVILFATSKRNSNCVGLAVFWTLVVVMPEMVSIIDTQASVPMDGSNCGKLMVEVDAFVVSNGL